MKSPDAVVVRFSALGDVVLTTGVLEHWQSTLGMRFVFITKKAFAPVLEGHPALSEIIALNDSQLSGSAWLCQAYFMASKYAGLPLIDLHGSLRTRILRFFWKGKTHHYTKYSIARRAYHRFRQEWAQKSLLQWNVPQRYALALQSPPPSAKALIPHLHPTRTEISQAHSLLESHGYKGERAHPVALHPYATHTNKKWPEERWKELALLLTRKKIPWVVIGRDDAPARWTKEMSGGVSHDFTNTTDLRQSCALLASCRMLVTGDSGPMHLACGVGTPVIALFGPTTRAWGFYPEGPHDKVLESDLECRPCSLHGGKTCPRERECMRSIRPEDVLEAIIQS